MTETTSNTESRPIAEVLMAMKPGDKEAWPIRQMQSLCTVTNRLKVEGRGEWKTRRDITSGRIEATRIS